MGPSLQSRTELRRIVDRYRIPQEENQKIETTSCLISLVELRALITYMDNENVKLVGRKIDGVRVYFTRDSINEYKNQLSIAIVPTYDYRDPYSSNINGAGAENYFINDQIMCLQPGYSAENSGLCPPNCGGHNL